MAGSAQPHRSDGTARAGPVIVLSYPHSGAGLVQRALAAGTELACTSGTGIIPQCGAAAEAWRSVEGSGGGALSQLAVSALRGLVTAQVTAILAGAGKTRWCELAVASPSAAEPFLQVFPHTAVVCVHRRCLDVIRIWIQSSPWGLQGQGLAPYLVPYPGNNVAALAAYWAVSTEELLTFEKSNPRSALRLRYEDLTARPDETLNAVRAWLRLGVREHSALLDDTESARTTAEPVSSACAGEVPVGMIPAPLRRRIDLLNAELGNPPLNV